MVGIPEMLGVVGAQACQGTQHSAHLAQVQAGLEVLHQREHVALPFAVLPGSTSPGLHG